MIIIFSYWYATLEPSYPGEDLFMAGLGLMVAIFVSLVAFLTCLFVIVPINSYQRIHPTKKIIS
ncbi:hypothetical protein ACTWP4_17475 [Gracilibacillus sp. D59]|uniref:hypothetical protein n=1 Tax=Gracilibacillus sp. D59 TaxID=3457434 RepID=UPI003FCDE444